MTSSESSPEKRIEIRGIDLDIYMPNSKHKFVVQDSKAKNKKNNCGIYPPGLIFIDRDISFTHWGIKNSKSIQEIKDIMIKDYTYMSNGEPYPRKMVALRGFFSYKDKAIPSGTGIVIDVTGTGYEFNEKEKQDWLTRKSKGIKNDILSACFGVGEGIEQPSFVVKEGVEQKHIGIHKKVLEHLVLEELITKPYPLKDCGRSIIMTIAVPYYNTGLG